MMDSRRRCPSPAPRSCAPASRRPDAGRASSRTPLHSRRRPTCSASRRRGHERSPPSEEHLRAPTMAHADLPETSRASAPDGKRDRRVVSSSTDDGYRVVGVRNLARAEVVARMTPSRPWSWRNFPIGATSGPTRPDGGEAPRTRSPHVCQHSQMEVPRGDPALRYQRRDRSPFIGPFCQNPSGHPVGANALINRLGAKDLSASTPRGRTTPRRGARPQRAGPQRGPRRFWRPSAPDRTRAP